MSLRSRPKRKKTQEKQTAAHSTDGASAVGEPRETAASHPLRSDCHPVGLKDCRQVLGVCIFLAAAVWVDFGQTLHYGFVNYDDNEYVYENSFVQKGLTWSGIRWAFTSFSAANWHPLTWISHMLDSQIYGLHAGGHHLTNVLLHTAATILLFLVFRRMTGALWRSAFVAAVFAVHPLRVESVAWVSERKDVLSALFFILTIGAYVRYARRPWSPAWYGLVLLLFTTGLMCKPMLVSLPFVLLLLDYWPLKRIPEFRISNSRWKSLLVEKIPFFVLAAASCVVTYFAQTVAIQPTVQLTLLLRVENALTSYMVYLGQMFWPSGLAVLYPFAPGGPRMSEALLSLALLAGISTVAFLLRRRCPYFLIGWLWYLIMLVPVIGIVQVGLQTHADRYTYLPHIGLYLLLAWTTVDWCAGWRYCRVVLVGSSTIILAALILCARKQATYWRDSESLWTHTLACTSDNPNACYNLGSALLEKDDVDKAIRQFQRALQMDPDYAETHNNLGDALLQQGKVDEAITQFQMALKIEPGLMQPYYNLGNALLQQGKVDEAVVQFQKALKINPSYADAQNNLGNALLQKGEVDEAIAHDQEALRINPDFADAHNNLGNALLQKGDVDGAFAQFQQALQIKPNYAEAHYNLGNALLKMGRMADAIVQFQQALQIKPDYAKAHNNLGSVLLQKGQVDEAIAHDQEALRIKPDFADAQNNLANALLQKGQVDEAIAHFHQALQLKPDFAEAQNNLAWLLATSPQASLRNGNQALALAQRANQLTGNGNPVILTTLAAAYAEAGRFSDAVSTAQRALQLAEAQSNTALADAVRSQLKFYQAGIPFHFR